jgi:glucokinase-like ROK family protein
MVRGMAGSFQLMKSLNKSLILNVIRTEGPISRADIAKRTQLTAPTVTNIVGELLESGLVIESDLGASSGGRKPILLRIHSQAFQVIGIDVGARDIKLVLTNLDAEILDSLRVSMPADLSNERLLALLAEAVRGIMDRNRLNKASVIGIGVGMHGLVNPVEGVSIYAPNLNLRNIPIRDWLQTAFALPVEVENDVRAMALGESWFGSGRGVDHFVCVNVGRGVGAGIIIDRKLFDGTTHTAGELGHITVDPEGPKCSCGNYGCLQALVSGPAIASRAKAEMQRGRTSIIAELAGGDADAITGETVHAAALQGDALAIEVLQAAGRYLGIGIAAVINFLNPARVIIGGGVAKAGDFLLEAVNETVRTRALQTPAEAASITLSGLGDHATAIGAVTLVLKKLFAPDYATPM